MVQVPFAVLAVPAALAVRAVPALPPDRHRPALRPNLDPRVAVRRADRGAVPARPAAGRGLAPLPGHRSHHRVGRTGRGVRRTPARPAHPAAGRGRDRRRLPARRRRAGRPGAAAVGAPGLDGRSPGPGRARAGTDGRPAHRAGDARSGYRAPCTAAGRSAPVTSGSSLGLAILTPVFTADLQDAQEPAQEAITALVLDAPLQAGTRSRSRGRWATSCRRAGPGARPAPRVRGAGPRRRRATRGGDSSATSTTSWNARRPKRSATRSSSPPGSRWPALVSVHRRRAGGVTRMTRSPARGGPAGGRRSSWSGGVLGVQVANGGGTSCRSRRPTRARPGTSRRVSDRHRRPHRAAGAARPRRRRVPARRQPRGAHARPGPGPRAPTDAQIAALRAGLLGAVDRMKADGTLPPASSSPTRRWTTPTSTASSRPRSVRCRTR